MNDYDTQLVITRALPGPNEVYDHYLHCIASASLEANDPFWHFSPLFLDKADINT